MEQRTDERTLTQATADLEAGGARHFVESKAATAGERERIETLMRYCGRIIDLQGRKKVGVIGCGPQPDTVKLLASLGHDVSAIEPVPEYVRLARDYLGEGANVDQGTAESVPWPSGSMNLVLLESVLEHVDSIGRTLAETYRMLAPGGLAVIGTTNRWRIDLRGRNGEYNVPFFNWFPAILKESFVFQHLHYDGRLANFTARPAVHWFTFDELCAAGRDAGFAQFYSRIDVLRPDDPEVAHRGTMLRRVLPHVQRNPFLRTLALSQMGGLVFMWKRA